MSGWKQSKALQKLKLDKIDWISWAAYNASIQEAASSPAAITSLLPLFPGSAHSVAMIKHPMSIVQAAVQHLNPGQVPVLTKQIQWSYPTSLGEGHLVVMFGGLHIENAILKVQHVQFRRNIYIFLLIIFHISNRKGVNP